jgi:hypothetical protein
MASWKRGNSTDNRTPAYSFDRIVPSIMGAAKNRTSMKRHLEQAARMPRDPVSVFG